MAERHEYQRTSGSIEKEWPRGDNAEGAKVKQRASAAEAIRSMPLGYHSTPILQIHTFLCLSSRHETRQVLYTPPESEFINEHVSVPYQSSRSTQRTVQVQNLICCMYLIVIFLCIQDGLTTLRTGCSPAGTEPSPG
ncbi:hypothetical protein K474DRAFT_1670207 [Panus rudis PR-1116 ss-1]|nr:hypothetical protein K474DRAFT_1670207 [Panus rudis PR-1116 ss-1]